MFFLHQLLVHQMGIDLCVRKKIGVYSTFDYILYFSQNGLFKHFVAYVIVAVLYLSLLSRATVVRHLFLIC